MRGGHRAQRAEQRIDDGLARLDIAGDDGGGRAWIQHGAQGRDDLQRAQAARVHRDVALDEAAEDIEHGRLRHARGCVEIVGALRARSREVDRRGARFAVDAYGDLDDCARIHRRFERAVGEPADHRAHGFFGVVLHVAHIGRDHVRAVFGGGAGEFRCAALAGGDLCFQIGDVLTGIA